MINSIKKQPITSKISQNRPIIAILAGTLLLWGLGLLMIYGLGDAKSDGYYNIYLMKRHLKYGLIGMVLVAVCTCIPLERWKRASCWITGVSVVCLFLVWTPLGVSIEGVRFFQTWWLGFRVDILLIIGMIFLFASVTERMQKNKNCGIEYFLLISGLAIAAYIVTVCIVGNGSYAITILWIAFCLTFIFAERKRIHGFIVTGFALWIVGCIVYALQSSDTSYRITKIKSWLSPSKYALDERYQTVQCLNAIKRGGLFGVGYGKGDAKKLCPEIVSSRMFSGICEQFGMVGAVLTVLVIAVLLYGIYRVSLTAFAQKMYFGASLCIGVLAHFGLMTAGNIATNLNLIPVSGGMIPFLNYKGTSVIFYFIEIGVVLAVARTCNPYADNEDGYFAQK